ncbi:MAG: cyclase family protein [Geminicoccaceae bacterium]
MPRIVDLSMAIENHFRWPVERHLKSDHARGDPFQVTWLGWPVHGFTHMDSPRHFFADGRTTSDIPLEATVGEAAVVDLTPIAPNQAITAERLAAAAAHVREGDIVVMKSCWEQHRSPWAPEFWTEAPYLCRDAATWLLERAPRAVAFDFPQDYTIRLLLQGEVRPLEEHVTHDVLLRNGVILIEYLANTAALTAPRTFLCCLPLKIPDCDGAPARVIALEDL